MVRKWTSVCICPLSGQKIDVTELTAAARERESGNAVIKQQNLIRKTSTTWKAASCVISDGSLASIWVERCICSFQTDLIRLSNHLKDENETPNWPVFLLRRERNFIWIFKIAGFFSLVKATAFFNSSSAHTEDCIAMELFHQIFSDVDCFSLLSGSVTGLSYFRLSASFTLQGMTASSHFMFKQRVRQTVFPA